MTAHFLERMRCFHVETSQSPPFGAGVRKGVVLVELAMPAAEAYHEQTKAALQEAETAYANAKAQYQAPVDAAQKQLDAARASAQAAGVNGETPSNSAPDRRQAAD